MVKEDLTVRLAGLILAALAVGGLSACASPTSSVPGDYPDESLTDTKSPAQLLRNEAANRIPADVIDEIIESEDVSVACLSEQDDPDGTIRSWHSTADVLIRDGNDVKQLTKDLAASFEEQGWVSRTLGGNVNVVSKLLESDSSLASIQVSGFEPNAEDIGTTGQEDVVEQLTVQVQVHGPCVRTDGKDSDEVKSLEGR
jgi:hypothetical protein